MINDDEYLERIIAGIQSASTTDAVVKWNDKINGRQFDVSVRFKFGTLRYLVLIEVRNRTRRASVSDVESFVTKARDQHANKSVFVTAAGFQEGAIAVAKKHGIDLFTVAFDENEISLLKDATFITLRDRNASKNTPPQVSVGQAVPVANIENVTLIYEDERSFVVPNEQSQMNYYVQKTSLSDGRRLGDLLEYLPSYPPQINESHSREVQIKPPQKIIPPDEFFFPSGVVNSIKFTVTIREARPIRGNVRVDPNLFTMPVVYTNSITGESTRFDRESLPLGFARVLPGRFYFTCHPLAYFYCDNICENTVEWRLVETFQNGDLFQAKMKGDIKYSTLYIPVTDKKILNRLHARLNKLRTR